MKYAKSHVLLGVGSLLTALISFFPVFFIQNPEQLPFSQRMFAVISQCSVLILFLPLLYGIYRWQQWRGIALLAVMGGLALGIELFGIQTGVLYSDFSYGTILGAKILAVPWTVPFSWLPLFFLTWVSVRGISSPLVRILVGSVLMVGLDLVLDPGATNLAFWTWAQDGFFYGVPLHNFGGWLVSSVLALGIWEMIKPREHMSDNVSVWLISSGLLSLGFWIGVNVWLMQWIPVILGGILVVGTITVGDKQN